MNKPAILNFYDKVHKCFTYLPANDNTGKLCCQDSPVTLYFRGLSSRTSEYSETLTVMHSMCVVTPVGLPVD